ncbi:hypothetical protein SAMN05660206_1102 [Sphingobacterium wenxiniae]|uniref:Uncharacterized protein n=1 Tax=Sphingobacterium wenxiniae TaxID=683125 RepID=A0A1I6USJ8_9SPHI|nr:hypothetical protein SAMN05660206_1102 [Sphingobacterium wenxiniae]
MRTLLGKILTRLPPYFFTIRSFVYSFQIIKKEVFINNHCSHILPRQDYREGESDTEGGINPQKSHIIVTPALRNRYSYRF